MVKLSSFRQTKQTQQKTMGLDSAEILSTVGTSTKVYDTMDSLPMSNLVAGQKALVTSLERIYLSDGNGWYNLDLSTGFSPRWDIEPDDAYFIADSVTPLLITAKALDSDNPVLLNQSFASDSAQYLTSNVLVDSSVFTFIPRSVDSINTLVSNGDLADSNGSFTYTFKWSDGINILSKEVLISYYPGGVPGTGLYAFYVGGYSPGQSAVYRSTISTQSSASSVGNLSYGAGLMGATGEANGYRLMTWGGKIASQSNTESVSLYNTNTNIGVGWGTDLHINQYARQGIMCVSDANYAYAYGGERWTEYSYNDSRKKSWASSTTSTHIHTLTQERNRAGLETDGNYTIMAGGTEGGGTAGSSDYYTSIEHWTNVTQSAGAAWGDLGFTTNRAFTGPTLFYAVKASTNNTEVHSVSYTTSGNAVSLGVNTAGNITEAITGNTVYGVSGYSTDQSFYNIATGVWAISGTGGPYGSAAGACTGS